MALNKTVTQDKIEIVGPYKNIQIRDLVRVTDGDEIVSESYKRKVINCQTKSGGVWSDTDVSSESSEVQAIASACWTDSVKSDYRDFIDAQELSNQQSE